MFTLKHVVVFIILQNTVSSSYRRYFELSREDYFYSESEESMRDDEIYAEQLRGITENNVEPLCPEKDQSLISRSDIKYLIENKVEILKIKENLENSYYPETKEILKKYMDELEEFQKQFEDRPEHILHILNDMASLRQELEPDVQEIAAKLGEFHILENNYNAMAEVSANLLNQLEKYKNICEINCEDYGIENRFSHNMISYPPIFSYSPGMYCIRLKDLNDNISEKLSAVQTKIEEDSNHHFEIRSNKISEFKNNLKEAAVKQFGTTMYDILSLQDDYHHFAKDLTHVNISLEIYDILENTAEIELRLIGMKRNLEKFRKYCMKCNTNRRMKRDVFELWDGEMYNEGQSYPTETTIDDKSNIVDELINATLNEITEIIKMNFTTMFEELDKKLNDPDVINLHLNQLHSIQNEIGNNIKIEQAAFDRLSNSISEASIEKIRGLSQESKQMIQSLESAKQFIDAFITSNSK